MGKPTSLVRDDPINAVRWLEPQPPASIFVIRLQALGDTVAILPYAQALKVLWPDTEIDFLTLEVNAELPRSVDLFHNVFSIRGARNARLQLACGLLLLPCLAARRYEIVIDLQRNRISQLIRNLLRPRAWSEFDRFSAQLHGVRARRTIESLGVQLPPIQPNLRLKNGATGEHVLRRAGWNGQSRLIVLNPAGGFSTRNWPLRNYVADDRVPGQNVRCRNAPSTLTR